MKKKDKLFSALLAVFPNVEAFSHFSENKDNHKALQSVVAFAARNDLIKQVIKKAWKSL
jgi:hypothetical protein